MAEEFNEIIAVLKAQHIRPTKIREEILNLFFDVNHALSHSDIFLKLKNKFDRVTIYRTLEMFGNKGLIHKIVDNSGVTKYASHGHGGCDVNFKHHKTNHIHFKCKQCGNIYCLCSIEVPKVDVPAGYEMQVLNLSAEGICKICSS
ncbi:transcriptional repressor [candidate division KSB1 bacterium]|nr:transcriptional repressor [candidate division KSB1 bacterium]MBL7094826.1 transcriptional repressor [candidate division KSB1 bacterium]